MVHRYRPLSFLVLAITLAACQLVRAADVTSHVPPGALGFVVVRNLAATNAKLQNLIRLFEAPLPAPLELFKLQTGFGEGFNDQGDLLVALLPPQDEFGAPGPLALVPVSDYAAFVKAFNGDPSGEICPVTVAEEDVLVAKAGEYALFMNPEYREQMQQIVSATPQPSEDVTALGEWVTTNDATLVLLPAGTQLLVSMAAKELDNARAQMEQGFEDLQLADELATLRAGLDMYAKLLGVAGDEVASAAAGLAIDDAGNAKLGLRAVAKQDGKIAQIGQINGTAPPLTGIPAGPFVMAGGGRWPQDLSNAMMNFSIDLMKSMPEVYGLQEASEEDLKRLEESYSKAFEGVRHVTFLVRPGEGEDPLYSNIYIGADVTNTEEYLKGYRESMSIWNEISAKAQGDVKFEYEITDETIGGKAGILITMDLSGAMALPDVPQARQMMQKMFGEDGKMRFYVAPVDDSRLLMGFASKASLEQTIESIRQEGAADLVGEASVTATAKLLPADAAFAGYISPIGSVQWFSRMMNVMMGAFGGGGPMIPAFPQTPPIGIAAGLDGRVVETDIVFPAEMLRGLSDYIKENLK